MSEKIPEYDWTPYGMVQSGLPVYVGSWIKVSDHKRIVEELQDVIDTFSGLTGDT
jgi:hypothetical protein